jgi:hypothetical protein
VVFILVHSPLVGPFTWALVAGELRQRETQALVPALRTPQVAAGPYWKRHAGAVAEAVAAVPGSPPPILIAHSGAGVLLPAIRLALDRPVAGYIFVDAALPQHGKSRLDLFDDPEAVQGFRQSARSGLLPLWTGEDLREVIPDDDIRRRFVADLRPLPLAAYEEPIPVFAGWPDAPCAYLRFGSNPAYAAPARQAQEMGWAYEELPGEHFHMLVDPAAVTGAILRLARRI